MYELVATGPGAKQQWRRTLSPGATVRLGREPANGWAVPWDLRVSREHADLHVEREGLRVTCLASARNPASFRGQLTREFVVRRGEEFKIGGTTFQLLVLETSPPDARGRDDKFAVEPATKPATTDHGKLARRQPETEERKQRPSDTYQPPQDAVDPTASRDPERGARMRLDRRTLESELANVLARLDTDAPSHAARPTAPATSVTDLDSIRAELDRLEGQISASLREPVAREPLRREVEDLQAEVAALKSQLAEATQARNAAERRAKQAETEAARQLEDERRAAEERLRPLLLERENQRAALAVIEEKLAAEEAAGCEAEALAGELAERLHALEAELQQRSEAADSTTRSLREELAGLQQQLNNADATSRAQLSDLQRQLAAADDATRQAGEELIELQRQLAVAHETRRELEVREERAQQLAAQQLDETRREAEQRLQAEVAERLRWAGVVSSLELRLAEVERTSADRIAEATRALADVEQRAERAAAAMAEQQRAAEASAQQLQDELADRERVIERLQSQLSEAAAAVELQRAAEASAQQLQDELADRERVVERLQSQLTEATAAVEQQRAAEASAQQLQDELADRERVVEQLQSQLSKAAAEHRKTVEAMQRAAEAEKQRWQQELASVQGQLAAAAEAPAPHDDAVELSRRVDSLEAELQRATRARTTAEEQCSQVIAEAKRRAAADEKRHKADTKARAAAEESAQTLQARVAELERDLAAARREPAPAPVASPPGLEFDGAALGEYQLLDQLSKGGTGQVLKAQHRRLGRLAAIKIQSSAAKQSPDLNPRFQRQMQLLAQLNHPNIAAIYDAGETGGYDYLIMEFVDGSQLTDAARTWLWSAPLVANAVLQAARALAYLHGRGIQHRHVCPANLLVSGEGVVKLIGLGGAATDEDLPPSPPSMDGNFDFHSPEQSLPSLPLDERTDIYSLGCTLFTALCRQPLFPVESTPRKVMAHRYQSPPSLRALRPDIPAALDDVFQRMVQKSPDARFATMLDAISALEEAASKLRR